MKLQYLNASLPNNKQLLNDINEAAVKIYTKLNHLDVNSIDISDYNKKYLGKYLRNLRSTMQKYSYLLAWSLSNTNIPREKFVFVEYGGGCGMMSLLARQLGVNTVIYNDIYDVSCNDAKTLASILNSRADDYICGDLGTLIDFFDTKQMSCSAIASYDVIEHIYDINAFLQKLTRLSDTSLNVVMASGANPYNRRITKQLENTHKRIEYIDRQPEWGHKERDCLKAYIKARRGIISSYAPSLTEQELDLLSTATRGLIKSDIEICINEYLETKVITRKPDHHTNTCDPYTGNWAEHIMDVCELCDVLKNSGFEARVFCGYYGSPNHRVKRCIGFTLNLMISLLNKYGLFISPFYVLYGQKFEK